ncbi:MAG: bifunctional precorrin-2 dehydrogenase/sirohydrochlorin ferrochelatase [Anaerolineaceae bacterium]|nr:bifunctional precorrin-2 dehydrogenase/sirohydrochlorin ferrochelatase [Anaerolineaceae bacterium]
MNYPVSLNLRGKTCVFVGGGAVAARKIKGLLHTGASIVVMSPALDENLQNRNMSGSLHWLQQRWSPGSLLPLAPALVFAATNDAGVNREVAEEARQLGALVNVADDGQAGDFGSMAVLRRPPLLVALDSGGSSPALARWLRDRIACCIREEHATLATWLGELRPGLRTALPQQERRQAFYREILESDVLALLGSDREEEARSLMNSMLENSR